MAKSKNEHASKTFDVAVVELEELIDKIDGEDVVLEDLIVGFREGTKLLAVCRKRLEEARQKVEKIEKEAFEEGEFDDLGQDVVDGTAVGNDGGGASDTKADDEVRLF